MVLTGYGRVQEFVNACFLCRERPDYPPEDPGFEGASDPSSSSADEPPSATSSSSSRTYDELRLQHRQEEAKRLQQGQQGGAGGGVAGRTQVRNTLVLERFSLICRLIVNLFFPAVPSSVIAPCRVPSSPAGRAAAAAARLRRPQLDSTQQDAEEAAHQQVRRRGIRVTVQHPHNADSSDATG